jgi:hypothetical protein
MSFRETLFQAKGRFRIEPVDTPLGRTYVRTMTAGDKDQLEMSGFKEDKKFRCRVVMQCCCDEAGRLEFGNKDLPDLNDSPAEFIDPIFRAAWKLNGYDEADREELRKNSASRGDDSSST